MRRIQLSLSLTLLMAALPLAAGEQHQSYLTYDDGGTTVRQSDGRSLDGRVNLPIFPGDEVTTARSGRSEVRLADGNVIAIDGGTTIRFPSILDSYEGEDSQSVAVLDYGKVIVHRLSEDSTALRLDTTNASYVSARDAIYAVETDGRGSDLVSVFDGTLEVRTRSRTSRLRSGDRARIDADGIYGISTFARDELNSFERWYLQRADRYTRRTSRYLDSRLAYADSYLDNYGHWVYVGDYGSWVWRPTVSVGWRPYYYGSWVYSPSGVLVWVSSEPWGWVPYHYGRWSFSSLYGWVWIPGGGYSPAWVYWAFGPSYVGWVPAGWYDCYRPYYNWAYRPYRHYGFQAGFGFYGHIRLSGTDLSPWTFVSPTGLVSGRVDRVALTTDAIRNRLRRDGDRASVTNNALRFDRNELKDPASAVANFSRRGIGGGTGKEGSGSSADLTPFFRRDPDLSPDIQNRISRRGGDSGGVANRGSSSPLRGDTTSRIDRDGNGPASVDRGPRTGDGAPRVGRQRTPGTVERKTPGPSNGAIQRQSPGSSTPAPAVRGDRSAPSERFRESNRPDRIERDPAGPDAGRQRGAVRELQPPDSPSRNDRSWRGGVSSRPDPAVSPAPARIERGDGWRRSVPVGNQRRDDASADRRAPNRNSSDRDSVQRRSIPRQVIDGIGGARITPGTRDGGRVQARPTPSRESARPAPSRDSGRASTPPPRVQRPAATPKSSSDKSNGRVRRHQ